VKGTKLIGAVALMLCGLVLAGVAEARTTEASKKQNVPVSTRPTADIVPLPSIKSLTTAQAAGKKLFVQKCSVCHLPALPSYTAYGPLLDHDLVSVRGEEATRQQIQFGSARMPGFQYSLTAAEIGQIVEYLKTLHFSKNN
jgi:mono/diheme cytochrome c family protein